MLALTPSERRGALVLVVLLLVGAGHDLWRARATGGAPPDAGRPASSLDRAAPDGAGAPVADSAAGEGSGRDSSRSGLPRTPARTHARLDLNRAGAGELDGLPGVGPVLAGRIVLQRRRYGPFRSVDELLAVRGVGPRLLERIRLWATVGPPRDGAPRPAPATRDSMAESQP